MRHRLLPHRTQASVERELKQAKQELETKRLEVEEKNDKVGKAQEEVRGVRATGSVTCGSCRVWRGRCEPSRRRTSVPSWIWRT